MGKPYLLGRGNVIALGIAFIVLALSGSLQGPWSGSPRLVFLFGGLVLVLTVLVSELAKRAVAVPLIKRVLAAIPAPPTQSFSSQVALSAKRHECTWCHHVWIVYMDTPGTMSLPPNTRVCPKCDYANEVFFP